ncbi:hypothetical protein [Mycolicibacterium sphagni]|uniref:Uncharacterized protein n=1 Tax=Mycolicibacterium sphagni TaxID=1786 RepID=A0A255DKR3_9MYCO|nr:hypothetical protein [Mycolicibacterium sphagni]OYN79988.1 hypothetical protein CG716_11055 [Mycolicibacterium sphagni]
MSEVVDIEIPVVRPIGIGGFVGRWNDHADAVLTLLLEDGDAVHIALEDELLAAVESKAIELRAAKIETAELLMELGLYREG